MLLLSKTHYVKHSLKKLYNSTRVKKPCKYDLPAAFCRRIIVPVLPLAYKVRSTATKSLKPRIIFKRTASLLLVAGIGDFISPRGRANLPENCITLTLTLSCLLPFFLWQDHAGPEHQRLQLLERGH